MFGNKYNKIIQMIAWIGMDRRVGGNGNGGRDGRREVGRGEVVGRGEEGGGRNCSVIFWMRESGASRDKI